MKKKTVQRCSEKRCRRPMAFDAPKNWCEEHWIEWWVNGLIPKTKAECVRALRAILTEETWRVVRGRKLGKAHVGRLLQLKRHIFPKVRLELRK